MEYFFYAILLLIFSTTIIGCINWYKLPTLRAKSIVGFLCYTFVNELVALIFQKYSIENNLYLYNSYIILSFSYIIWLLSSILQSWKSTALARFLLIVYILFVLLETFYIKQSFNVTLNYSYVVGTISVLIMASFYMFECFSEELILVFRQSIYFWFILGVVLFHIPFLPFIMALDMTLIENNDFIYNFILTFLNILMYGSIIYGFKCSIKNYNY
ncbi:hypothetical protein GV828_07255 [Flavobacterium sp. NST-5]|uniref:Histidine kinase n=1 Tax=Flavobacterium ichthyis TaxID=2698827 RepID=A0ABW9Z8P8_9FLAO|nr:hypothetical protein [Flavobacterium ichthyis]NBL64994.1 hypothetical protein [Flavobacterium ichthyis]